MTFAAESGPPGVAVTTGAVRASGEWWFAGGATSPGTNEGVMIASAGAVDTEVDVQAYLDGEVALGPVTVPLSRDGVVYVPIGGCNGGATVCVPVPPGTGYALEIYSENATPFVAEIVGRYGTARASGGAVLATGVIEPARDWVFGRTRVTNERGGRIDIANPGTEPVDVSLAFVHDGGVDEPASLQKITVPANRRVAVTISNVAGLEPTDAAVIVRASGPVVAERIVASGNERTRSAGIVVRTS
jgi:hypothetical protein